jgi:hypothetical protein
MTTSVKGDSTTVVEASTQFGLRSAALACGWRRAWLCGEDARVMLEEGEMMVVMVSVVVCVEEVIRWIVIDLSSAARKKKKMRLPVTKTNIRKFKTHQPRIEG